MSELSLLYNFNFNLGYKVIGIFFNKTIYHVIFDVQIAGSKVMLLFIISYSLVSLTNRTPVTDVIGCQIFSGRKYLAVFDLGFLMHEQCNVVVGIVNAVLYIFSILKISNIVIQIGIIFFQQRN